MPADYIARRSLYLPEKAQYDWIMQQAATSGADLSKLVTEAMTAIETEFEPLLGVLPKDYGIFEIKDLAEKILPARTSNDDANDSMTGGPVTSHTFLSFAKRWAFVRQATVDTSRSLE